MSHTTDRPLSPHLQVYRLPLLAVMSISHRLTGAALSLGSVLLAIWLIAAAAGEASFAAVNVHLQAWYGVLLMVLWSFALFYHLCNGIRHLVWDAGYGLELRSAYVSGYVTIAASVVLTLLAWVPALV